MDVLEVVFREMVLKLESSTVDGCVHAGNKWSGFQDGIQQSVVNKDLLISNLSFYYVQIHCIWRENNRSLDYRRVGIGCTVAYYCFALL